MRGSSSERACCELHPYFSYNPMQHVNSKVLVFKAAWRLGKPRRRLRLRTSVFFFFLKERVIFLFFNYWCAFSILLSEEKPLGMVNVRFPPGHSLLNWSRFLQYSIPGEKKKIPRLYKSTGLISWWSRRGQWACLLLCCWVPVFLVVLRGNQNSMGAPLHWLRSWERSDTIWDWVHFHFSLPNPISAPWPCNILI